MKYKNFYFLLSSIIIFSCSLYYKQYLPNYLNHSIVILLIIIYIYIITIIKKFTFIKYLPYLLSICLLLFSIGIIGHNDKLSTDGKYIGIDISKWNSSTNLELAKQEIDYVIVRCGYTSLSNGTSTKEDPYFKENIKQCKEFNIPYGIYYYSLARDETQAKKEADFVTNLLKQENIFPPLGIFIDIEDEKFQGNLSNEQLCLVATTFLDNIPNENIKGIYANYHWWSTKLTDSKLNNYIKWVARYNDNPTIENGYTILQYSQTGKIKGINGNVDLNMTHTKYWQK